MAPMTTFRPAGWRLGFLFGALGVLALPLSARAQLSAGVSGLTDDNAKGYLSPLPKALSSVLNTSIFQSGDVPRQGLNFELGVSLTAVNFDDGDRTSINPNATWTTTLSTATIMTRYPQLGGLDRIDVTEVEDVAAGTSVVVDEVGQTIEEIPGEES